MRRLSSFLARSFSAVVLACACTAAGVERFGDITVAPQSLASGETHHGYREFRVLLENHSARQTHQVRLVFPDRPFGFGDSIRRISRTVSLGPASRAVVPLWQPPLPATGDNNLRVWIDDEDAGTVTVPEAMQHMNRFGVRYGGLPAAPASILVSRSLNFDDVTRAFKSDHAAFSASMATGPADSRGRMGMTPTAWSPDPSRPGPHWIELDYDPPTRADRVRIYQTAGAASGGEIILTGVSGTNLASVPIPAPVGVRRPGGMVQEVSFPLTAEPVKTVRLNFGSTFGGSIAVDAVELEGSSGSGSIWASSARASSEAPSPGAVVPGISGSGIESRSCLRAELPTTEWSESWLSYTPFDAVILNAADASTMPPAVAAAVWRYAECGGNLILLGGGEVPEPWRSFRKTSAEDSQSFEVGFGRCFVVRRGNPSELTADTIKALGGAIADSSRYWDSLPDNNAANASFPVVENARIPVRSTVFVMLTFVILIGPVNLIVLSRLNRRTWLLWTIPAISFATCLLVFAYSLLREGITPDVRIESLTVLDQVNRRASTIGRTGFYCPLTPSQGLFFGFETEATPLIETVTLRSGTPREVDWTEAQHLQRGWVTARVPAHFQLRKSETRRERLQLESANGQLTVVNGLGAAVRSLWLADGQGRIHKASNIAAGQKAALSGIEDSSAGRQGVRSMFDRGGFSPEAEFLTATAATCLSPNTYVAELETNPFLENGLGPKAKSTRTKSRSVVYGILEPDARP